MNLSKLSRLTKLQNFQNLHKFQNFQNISNFQKLNVKIKIQNIQNFAMDGEVMMVNSKLKLVRIDGEVMIFIAAACCQAQAKPWL